MTYFFILFDYKEACVDLVGFRITRIRDKSFFYMTPTFLFSILLKTKKTGKASYNTVTRTNYY